MGLFNFLKRLAPPPPSSVKPEVQIDLETAQQQLIELLRPHLRATSYGFISDEDTASLPITASKVGGEPYAEAGDVWPIDRDTGEPRIFLLQINSADVPLADTLPRGMLVVFADAEDMDESELQAEDGPLVVRYYPDADATSYVSLQKPDNVPVIERTTCARIVFDRGSSLPNSETIAGRPDHDLYRPLNDWMNAHGSIWYGVFRDARTALLGEQHERPVLQIGGHPQWVQWAEPPGKRMLPHERFMMQINTSRRGLGHNWYDEGSIYIYSASEAMEPDWATFQAS